MAAPFKSSVMSVLNDWIDYNGHLNMAYYNVLFDRCIDEVHDALGLGPGYRRNANASTFTAQAHIIYVRELHAGDKVHVTCHMLDADEKRIHSFLELHHAEKGFLSAVSEQLHLHVDLKAKRVAPFPPGIADNIDAMRNAHSSLARSLHIGRAISIGEK
ncbi:Acyl-CoA thioesterase [hydrothermal vent metagenome]|uniref:Acyl-CoA thioesterase n=1 Tax=hydrothermal vent metagenome TaxID=652676 RepID=A0A3B0TU38_9ZZZZ